MEFRLLGPLEVEREGTILPLGGPKQRAVLAHLLLHVGGVVSTDRLIDAIWDDDPPETARNTLQTYIRHLRKAVGSQRIRYRSSGYVLAAEPSEVDALRFAALLDRARELRADDPVAAVAVLEEALGLWRGPAIDDLAEQRALQPDITRLEEQRLAATEERIGAEIDLGRYAEVVAELEALVQVQPLRERAWAQLMTALYLSGRQADALATFQRARELLQDGYGIDPSPDLRLLHERILRQDPDLEVVGLPVRGYRLLEPLGAGSFGSVHRAFQPQIGREVAVKTIHERFSNDPAFIRGFEAEAQLVARLEHPHIVPLYDFWRGPEGAFLVMRFLRGGNLRERLVEQGPMATDDAVRLVHQLALALDAAHRHGVIHRDVKPENVLFDDDGNGYLTDFGIARDLAAEVVREMGSSPLAYYLAPEELAGGEASSATDVYGLGVLAFEALVGRHPFADSSPAEVIQQQLTQPLPDITRLRTGLPPGCRDVIDRATAKHPEARFASTTDFADALGAALDVGIRPVADSAARNPYKGLLPFTEADAADFHGRGAVVARLLDRLREPSPDGLFLAIVGPSGSGKSSVVSAGLIPALRGGGVAGSERWFVTAMHPGAQPFDELAAAIARIAVDPPPDLSVLLDTDRGLERAAGHVLAADPTVELVLVIDQFEELFTQVADEATRGRFIARLTEAASDPRGRIRIVVTLRADFYDRPLSYSGFGDLLATRTEPLPPLTVEELERAVCGPAVGVGAVVEPGVVTEIVADVAARPGTLPLLQYALTELFERRDGDRLTLEAYRRIGGVSGALAQRAEELYERLPQPGKEATRQLFLRLVTLGDEGADRTRRRVLRSELMAVEGDPASMGVAIDAFGARRLLSFDRDPVSRAPTVEVAHEALLREWERLRDWITAARDDVRMHRRLAAATAEWEEAARDASFVLRGDRLARVEAWAGTSELAFTHAERAFLDASLAQQVADRSQEESRQAREAELERRSVRRLRGLVAVFAVLALVATGLTALTVDQRRRAEREARRAGARELAAAATANLGVDPELSILLALEAVDATQTADGTVVREAEEALHRALTASRVVFTVPQGNGLSLSPDGRRFATVGADGDATIRSTDSGDEMMAIDGGEPGLRDIAFSRDGRRLVTAGLDGAVQVWDAGTGEPLDSFQAHAGESWRIATSPTQDLVATTGADGLIGIDRIASGARMAELRTPGDEPIQVFTIPGVSFSPDGEAVASAIGNRRAAIWDLSTGEITSQLVGHEWDVTTVVFSPDGERVATASIDGTATIWSAASGDAILTLTGHTGEVHSVAFSPSGDRIATGGSDATVRVWDPASGRELLTLTGHTGAIEDLEFTPDGDRLLSASEDGTTRAWDVSLEGGRDWLTVPGPFLRLGSVAFAPGGETFVVPGDRSGMTMYDAATGAAVRSFQGHAMTVWDTSFDPEGSRLAAAAGTGATARPANDSVPIWDVATGQLMMELVHDGEVTSVEYSNDGREIATGSLDQRLRIWDAATGEELRSADIDGETYGLAYSTDGRWIVTGIEVKPELLILDVETLETVGELVGHRSWIQDIAIGPGDLIASASGDGTARIWDLAAREELLTLRGHTGPVQSVAFSPDGRLLATAGDDGTARLWDVETGDELLVLYGHELLAHTVTFSPDGRLLATASADGTVALRLLPVEELRQLARTRVSRGLTDRECHRYLHVETCPRR